MPVHLFKRPKSGGIFMAACAHLVAGDEGDSILSSDAGPTWIDATWTDGRHPAVTALITCLFCRTISTSSLDEQFEYCLGAETLGEQRANKIRLKQRQDDLRKEREKAEREAAEKRAKIVDVPVADVGEEYINWFFLKVDGGLDAKVKSVLKKAEEMTVCLLASLLRQQRRQESQMRQVVQSLASISHSQAKTAKAMERLLKLVDRRDKEVVQ